MPERSPAESVESYRRPRQRLIACVTDQILSVASISRDSPYQPSDHPHTLTLSEGGFVPMSGATPLSLRVIYGYEIVWADEGRHLWETRTREYTFSIALRDEGLNKELITYHWQPGAPSGIDFPHLHVGPAIARTALQIGNRYVHRMHVPTGVVPLASIIRLAIEEFEIRPLRDDWQQVLAQHESA